MSSVDDFIGAERLLEISSRCLIRFEANSFLIEQREEGRRATVPSGDVLALMLESEQATVTASVLAACGERGIPVIVCRLHKPTALMLSLDASWNGGEIRRKQARALRGDAAAKRLWRRTVKAKISSQASLLAALDGEGAERMKTLARDVDLENQETTEAQAAAIYWRGLLPNFRRSDGEDPRNALLNWGYAVLLAAIGRGLVALGFDPALGFGHSGKGNAWALACDLMEPFRPTIDAAVARLAREGKGHEPTEVKAAILAPFALDGSAKSAILEVIRGYRDFLDSANETRVRYPDGPLGT